LGTKFEEVVVEIRSRALLEDVVQVLRSVPKFVHLPEEDEEGDDDDEEGRGRQDDYKQE
jgi:hypothetical protein